MSPPPPPLVEEERRLYTSIFSVGYVLYRKYAQKYKTKIGVNKGEIKRNIREI